MSSTPAPAPARGGRKSKELGKRGAPLRTQAGKYSPLPTFFDPFPSFTRDTSRTPEQDFWLLQNDQNWEVGSTTYITMRRKFLAALVAETRSPVHAFFVAHKSFLEYDCTASPHTEFSRLTSQRPYPINRAAFLDAYKAEFNSPLDSFFRSHPAFEYNPRGAHMAEFRRLVKIKKWNPNRARNPEHSRKPESIAYNTARTAFFDAFRGEFDHLFGGDAESFSTWQNLCETLGLQPMPGSVTECQKATRPLMINIYDITHHKRTGAPFDFFKTLNDLRIYTCEKGLVFPLNRAKKSALKFLLRKIF